MRAGYSGSQRYGMIPWSGDVNRTWGGLKPQMEISLQMGLQGMAYMHSDLGGFAGANDEPELYVRWLQYGVFQPIFRPHAQEEVASEAIYKDVQTKALAKKAIESRYRMLPYNYTLAYQNTTKGWPLMRPIYMEFPKADWSFEQTEAYMWGSAFLVHAITDPMSSFKENTVRTKLPAGTPWFDFASGQLIEKTVDCGADSQFIEVQTPLSIDQIPVFVRAGSFVPMATVCQTTDAYNDTMVTVHYYHHATVQSASGEWYEDDGLTANAVQTTCQKHLQFSAKAAAKTLELTAVSTFGLGIPVKQFQYHIHVHCAKAPKKVKLDGKTCTTHYDASQQVLILTAPIKHNVSQFSHTILVNW
jgi:oligosaccharide 4-alpha-D-glucosyltransferase